MTVDEDKCLTYKDDFGQFGATNYGWQETRGNIFRLVEEARNPDLQFRNLGTNSKFLAVR